MSLDQKIEILRGIEKEVAVFAKPFMLPPNKLWQPADLLPDLTTDEWQDRLKEFREPAKGLTDPVLVVLVGATITEEALPNYHAAYNRHDGIRDKSGVDDHIWARWLRGWVAEEKRHGVALNDYLLLTGRVDQKEVQKSIHRLIRGGFDALTDNDPYLAFAYTSFQERATELAHGVVGKLAKQCGDTNLSKMCFKIAGDEGRHGTFYRGIMKMLFETDPNEAMLAYQTMMDRGIIMPIRNLDDPDEDPTRHRDFSFAAQKVGVHTGEHYVSIMQELNKAWDIGNRTGLRPEAAQAQEYLATLPKRFEAIVARQNRKLEQYKPTKFPWIFNREV